MFLLPPLLPFPRLASRTLDSALSLSVIHRRNVARERGREREEESHRKRDLFHVIHQRRKEIKDQRRSA